MATLNSKLKRGDEVIVIAGKDKGHTGKITSVDTNTNRVTVSGANVATKHIGQRAAMQLGREPGKTTKELPIAVSNVMLKDPKTGEPTRVGYKFDDKGNKVRVAKKSGEVIDTIRKAKESK